MNERDQEILKEAEAIRQREQRHRGLDESAGINKSIDSQSGTVREMTVRELLIRRIERADRQVREFRDMYNNLPGAFLDSPASRMQFLANL